MKRKSATAAPQLFHASAVVYISGPMTGKHDFNRRAFHRMEKRLIKLFGCRVLNPAKITDRHVSRYHKGLKDHAIYREYMRHDLDLMFEASHVILLSDWRKSKGARAEHALAECLNLGIVHETEI